MSNTVEMKRTRTINGKTFKTQKGHDGRAVYHESGNKTVSSFKFGKSGERERYVDKKGTTPGGRKYTAHSATSGSNTVERKANMQRQATVTGRSVTHHKDDNGAKVSRASARDYGGKSIKKSFTKRMK